MNIRRGVVTGGLCAIALGCGAANPANQLSPSSVTTARSAVDGGATPQLSALSIGSCPDGNAPSWLQTWTKGTTARLRWTEVAPTIDYHVVVERYDFTNKYVPVEDGNLFVINRTWTELTLGEGRYRAKIQTRSCGRYMGPWSDDLQFSVEGSDTSSPVESTPTVSAEGTHAFPGQTLIDGSGTVWSWGSTQARPNEYEVLRNGVSTCAAGAWGLQMKYHNGSVYLLSFEGDWYIFTGTDNCATTWPWTNVGSSEP